MRNIYFYISILLIIFFNLYILSDNNEDSGLFLFKIITENKDVPIEGPIPLNIQISYQGESSIEVYNLFDKRFLNLSFNTPPGWGAKKPPSGPINISGVLPIIKLTKGKTINHTIYLHDYFLKLEQGRKDLVGTLKIKYKTGDVFKQVEKKDSIILNIAKPNQEAFVRKIELTKFQIKEEQNEFRQKELMESVINLKNHTMIPVFIDLLSSHELEFYHQKIREKLFGLIERNDGWSFLINYLSKSGGENDEYFFQEITRNKLQLSPNQINDLLKASNFWIKIYTVKYLVPKEKVIENIETLEQELNQYRKALSALKKCSVKYNITRTSPANR